MQSYVRHYMEALGELIEAGNSGIEADGYRSVEYRVKLRSQVTRASWLEERRRCLPKREREMKQATVRLGG